MDDSNLSLNKRRHKPHSNSDYHPRYKKHANMGRDKWRTDYRESSRYIERPERNHVSNQYKESQDTMWDVEMNLIGQKESHPMIHLCDTCKLPIRSYGRLIPCKHVFCFKCAKKTDKNCPRCGDEVHRIEQCRHGTVWMCEVANCSRTYLSQRDLHAHVNHRHSKPPPPPNLSNLNTGPPPPGPLLVPPMPPSTIPQLQNPPAVAPYVMVPPISTNQVVPSINIPPHDSNGIQTPPDMIARPSSNLITIQIQDNQPMNFDQSASQSQQPSSMYSGPPPTCYSKSIPHNSQSRMSNAQWM